MPRTAFTPQLHGFHFGNRFVNRIATLPGGHQIETQGRCGGMAYAALDYFHARTPAPDYTTEDFPGTGVPPDGHWLADYIFGRLLDSYRNSSAIRFVSWTLHSDEPTFVFKGVTRWTSEDEVPRLRRFIDDGNPVVLGLIGARSIQFVGSGNHQVVAYGYDPDQTSQATSIYIYDNNSPDQEVTLVVDPGSPLVDASNRPGQPWRGFFVHEYKAVDPPRHTPVR